MKKILISLLLAAVTIVSFAAQTNLIRAHFTSNVVNGEPVDQRVDMDTSTDPIFFFTEVVDCYECKIVHRWFLNDRKQFDLNSTATAERFKFWSKVNTNGLTGTWAVEIYINGNRQGSRELVYQEATIQQAPAPTQRQLQKSLDSECEENLKHFHAQTQAHPEEPYYQYMFKKWGERCYGQ